jgi:hypothetical protein
MSIGSILVGIAALALVVAYVARPFRPTHSASIDRTIEAWVAQVQGDELAVRERPERQRVAERPGPAEMDRSARPINYCPQCGQRVASEDLFCSACGAQLRRSAE